MKQARMLITAVALSAILLGSTGCAPHTDVTRKPPMSEMTLIAAKNIALAAEDETAALVPPENIAKSDQFKTASLLSCSADEYEWPGQTTITLTGELDRQGLIDTIKKTLGRQARVHRRSDDNARRQRTSHHHLGR